MANYLALFVHLVWSTKRRRPLLEPELEPVIFDVIAIKCRALRCPAIAIGGMPDHVHVLVSLHPTMSVSALAKDLKGASAHTANRLVGIGHTFQWQTGYGAFSVSQDRVSSVRAYVLRQKEHHMSNRLSLILETYP